MCVSDSEVRHRAVLKAIERDSAAAADVVNGSPRSLQPVYDHVMAQSAPTQAEFIYNSPTTANHHVYSSRSQLHTDVRLPSVSI